jgi:hypothetical protein
MLFLLRVIVLKWNTASCYFFHGFPRLPPAAPTHISSTAPDRLAIPPRASCFARHAQSHVSPQRRRLLRSIDVSPGAVSVLHSVSVVCRRREHARYSTPFLQRSNAQLHELSMSPPAFPTSWTRLSACCYIVGVVACVCVGFAWTLCLYPGIGIAPRRFTDPRHHQRLVSGPMVRATARMHGDWCKGYHRCELLWTSANR